MAQRRRATPKLDPLFSVRGDPADIREAAEELHEAWRQWVAAGNEDDGRFDPLQRVFAPNDREVMLAADAVKVIGGDWKYRSPNPPHIAKLQVALRSALRPESWYDTDQTRRERRERREQRETGPAPG